MTVEATIVLPAAWSARSPALVGFGGDSAIELISATVVLWGFRSKSDCARIAGSLLFVLTACVIIAAGLTLAGFREPRPSLVGIILLSVAAIAMPWLARKKRKLAAEIGSASMKADASASAVCGYNASSL